MVRSGGVINVVIFELQQLAELLLIKVFDALLDILGKHEIRKFLQLAVVAGEDVGAP
jgi:hypothetical protein